MITDIHARVKKHSKTGQVRGNTVNICIEKFNFTSVHIVYVMFINLHYDQTLTALNQKPAE